MKVKIRNLKAEEIECRVGNICDNGIMLLLYKNARVDQAILDETFGIYGWQRTHCCINGENYCTVSIWDADKNCWVSKQDVGTESNAEKVKGAASDSFKRACFNLGIGRELYSAPSCIWIPIHMVQIREEKGRKAVKDRFSVSRIEISEDKIITALEIVNQRLEVVFTFSRAAGKPAEKHVGKPDTLTETQKRNLRKEMIRTGISETAILERFDLSSVSEMNEEIYQRALAGLKKTKSAA